MTSLYDRMLLYIRSNSTSPHSGRVTIAHTLKAYFHCHSSAEAHRRLLAKPPLLLLTTFN